MIESLKESFLSVAEACTSLANYLLAIIEKLTPDTLANGFSTLVGTLIGAMLAYYTQIKFQKKNEHEAALVSAHRLMFALFQQINTVVLIQKDYVYRHIKNPGKFLSIPATPPFDMRKNVLELPELSFLLESEEGRTILYNFYLAQENYIEAISQWNIRSQLHLEKVQPALALSELTSGGEITEMQLQKALGIHLYGSIVNATDNCIVTLQRAFQKLSSAKEEARNYLVKRFKSNNFTDFSTPDTFGLSEEANHENKKSET